MARSSFGRLIFWALAASLAIMPGARSEEPDSFANWGPRQQPAALTTPASSPASESLTCRIYPLGDLADDPKFCKWVAETIPNVIRPGTWNQKAGDRTKRVLTYPARRILVVYHSSAVHTEIAAFLKGLQQTATASETRPATMANTTVVPAQYSAPQPVPVGTGSPAQPGYLVPAPAKAPKHLFHFIIRYEGAGIIDANVVKMYANSGTAIPTLATPASTAPSETPTPGEPIAPPKKMPPPVAPVPAP